MRYLQLVLTAAVTHAIICRISRFIWFRVLLSPSESISATQSLIADSMHKCQIPILLSRYCSMSSIFHHTTYHVSHLLHLCWDDFFYLLCGRCGVDREVWRGMRQRGRRLRMILRLHGSFLGAFSYATREALYLVLNFVQNRRLIDEILTPSHRPRCRFAFLWPKILESL